MRIADKNRTTRLADRTRWNSRTDEWWWQKQTERTERVKHSKLWIDTRSTSYILLHNSACILSVSFSRSLSLSPCGNRFLNFIVHSQFTHSFPIIISQMERTLKIPATSSVKYFAASSAHIQHFMHRHVCVCGVDTRICSAQQYVWACSCVCVLAVETISTTT